ncbi:hypothetical protein ACPF8X_04460 [Streptomyces sp. G35A]
MAKNKNRDRKRPQAAERAQRATQPTALETPDEQRITQVAPGEMAHKGRQKRFGHN